MRKLWTVLAALSLTNCGYKIIKTNDQQVKSGWSEIVNQYQRRADLVPDLVNSVNIWRSIFLSGACENELPDAPLVI